MRWHASCHPRPLLRECAFFLLSERWAEETSATPGPVWSPLMEMLGMEKLEWYKRKPHSSHLASGRGAELSEDLGQSALR